MSAFFTKVWDHILDTVWPLKIQLPQNTGRYATKRRDRKLSDAGEIYQFN
jgi:hypothetical protein